MKLTLKISGLLTALLFNSAFAVEPAWSTSGLKMPESVEFDASRDRFYVANINGGIMDEDGNGSIGLLDGNGKLINVDWVVGLHSPKGLALRGDKLYVADIKQLVVINVETGKLVARYEAKESLVLNGISINQAGKVFVSDWTGNRIYTLDDGELKIWLESAELNSPNGLWAENDYLYVASWGSNPKSDFTTETTGNIKKINLKTKNIEAIDQNDRWINMDGIARYGKDKWLISDFIKGEILLMNKTGHVERTIISKKGSADIIYISKKNLIVVPLLMDNQISAYKLD